MQELTDAQLAVHGKALPDIMIAMAQGIPTLLIGTVEADSSLAEAANLPWLHEIPAGQPQPPFAAWDWKKDAKPDPSAYKDGGAVLGAGMLDATTKERDNCILEAAGVDMGWP